MVEDTLTCREPIAAVLRRAGYRVITACDGRSALDLLDDHSPHLALVDVAMPVMDGFDFLRELRRFPQWKDLPVILFTGSGDLSAMAGEFRVERCLVKSLASMAEIREAVAGAFAARAQTATAPVTTAYSAQPSFALREVASSAGTPGASGCKSRRPRTRC